MLLAALDLMQHLLRNITLSSALIFRSVIHGLPYLIHHESKCQSPHLSCHYCSRESYGLIYPFCLAGSYTLFNEHGLNVVHQLFALRSFQFEVANAFMSFEQSHIEHIVFLGTHLHQMIKLNPDQHLPLQFLEYAFSTLCISAYILPLDDRKSEQWNFSELYL